MRESELILNSDGSIYHLALMPEDVAPTVILVGDQDRVTLVSQHFDRIELKKQKREFITHTGWIDDKRISVMSTGIGTDNIDIVMMELDALVNVDFKTRTAKQELTSLKIIRIGTSGSIHPDLQLGDVLVSRYSIGTDSLGEYYGQYQSPHELFPEWSYLVKAYDYDLSKFPSEIKEGITVTCPGFYAPQGRTLRLTPEYVLPFSVLHEIRINQLPITNIDMETAAIYLFAEKMGHHAITFNLILAQRIHSSFIREYTSLMDKTIKDILTWIMKI